MPTKGVACVVPIMAKDEDGNLYTGDQANITPILVADGSTVALSSPDVTETDIDGVYNVSIANDENDYDMMALGGSSSTSGVSIIPTLWQNKQDDFTTTQKASLSAATPTVNVGSIATDAITAASLKADAVTEIITALKARIIDGTKTGADLDKFLLSWLVGNMVVDGNNLKFYDQSGALLFTLPVTLSGVTPVIS